MNRRVVPPTLANSSAARRALALVLLSGLCASAAPAGDRADPLAGARQLRSAPRRAPNESASAITRDVGQIAIVEHDGSNYDKDDASGAPNYAARAAVARRFYETHGDDYDFLVVFTNFEFSTPGALAFMNGVRNDVRGIGIPPFDLGASFGSPGRLKGYVDLAAVSRYRQPPLSLEPGHPGFLMTLGVVAHEVGHQWLAQARYRNAVGTDVADLLGQHGNHWSFLLDSDASFMYGSEWAPVGAGRFRAERIQETYSSLDLYLMGLLDASQVPPFTLLRNPAIDPTQVPEEGAVVDATTDSVRIDQVVAAEGARSPGFQSSQKEFRLAFLFLTAPGVEPSAEDLAAADRVRDAFAAHFFFHTRGVAIADTSLAEAPPAPPAPSPDLDRATAWLLARQEGDGRWEDSPGTAIRDTAAAVEALAPTLAAADAVERARAWLDPAPYPTTDHAARRALALADPLLGPSQREELIASVRTHEAPEGGFGIAGGYRGDALDTALALRALSSLGHPADGGIAQSVATLSALRHPSGGWAMVHGGEVSSVATAGVVLALQDWAALPDAQSLVGPALAALVTRRNPDGGFGESPSTPYATALALRALLAAHAPANVVDTATAWLQSKQQADGSWGGAYATALVIAALRAGQGPNLLVPQDSLHLDPSSATEGQVVEVSAAVRNAGHRVAGAQRVRLFDGDPALGQVVGEMAVAALEAGASAPVHFDFDTTGRPGARTLYVVADAAGEVTESREDDNAASRAIGVAGLLPDLEVGSFDIVVSPYPPQQGETVSVAVAVHNRGPRPSPEVRLDVTRGDPRAGGQTIGRATVPPIPPAESRTVPIQWDTSGQAGTHELFASADADFRLPESDETNNQASQVVTVTAAPVSGVDLELAQLRAEPPRLLTLPQDGAVQALVRNLGDQPSSSFVALHDGAAEGPLLGEQPVSLGPRSSLVVTFPVHVTAPGSRTFVALIDPAGMVDETREDNNRSSAQLLDGQDTVDVEVPPAGVVPSSTDLTVGEVLTVSARVRNRGTAPIADVPVILAHVTAAGPMELARRMVTLTPGTEAALTFAWTTSVVGDPLPLAVIADPFRNLDELSETNNAGSLAVRVRPSALPNLAVRATDIHFAPDPPPEGGAAVVSVVVRNTGAVDAPAFAVRFFRNDPEAGGTPIGETTVSGVAAGATTTAGVTWSPVDAAGNTLVFAVADAAGQVAEFDETDNRAFRPIGVLGLPDLVLTAGDVTLTPGFPRAGQAVGITAKVRNLGAQRSTEATLRAWEGEASQGTVIGDAAIPALQPQQSATLQLSWTPAAQAGDVVLSVTADALDVVREADEGNNAARRQVVIQSADVYLTEPFFSPDGDGRKDATTLAWRATGTVSVVVSDSRGRRVRTLATAAPSEGSAAWDGRDDRGRLLWDGAYTLTVEAADGGPLARTTAVLDTDRSPIQEAAATGLVSLHNMTCRLPPVVGPAWMPAEDEALFIVAEGAAGVEPGLIRVSLTGEWSYVGPGPDPWYAHEGGDPSAAPVFVSAAAVAPDGREVLIRAGADLVAVDVASGERRVVVAEGASHATWSPDGRWIALGNRVVSRDGMQELALPFSAFEWSPDGEWLTNGGAVVRRDGSGARGLPLPDGTGRLQEERWLGDGRILVRDAGEDPGLQGGREPGHVRSWLIDPDTDAVEELTWLDALAGFGVHPTPDGSRIAYQRSQQVDVVRADGTNLRLIDAGERGYSFGVSPRDRVAFYSSDAAAQPGQACEGLGADVFALASLQNMTLDLQAARLPANNGLALRGTAVDRHLGHYQLEYADTAEPGEWRPIGPASAVPVLDDTLAVWVPPAPGTYAVRLRAEDLAGNVRAVTRVVAWDRTPSLANVAQSERLISPTGDGVKDAVRVTYLVVEPTTVEVRINGPQAAGQPGPLVKRLALAHPQTGPASFDWDGRDEAGGVVRDGRYTVSVNDIPLRVDVDATPPDVAWSYHGLGSEAVAEDPPAGRVVAERRWHVVDPHLAGWSYRNAFFTEAGTEPVFEPERDADGEIVYLDGVPRVRYEGGRPADTKLKDPSVEELGTDPTASLSATDHAGNRSTVPVLPVTEKLFLLAAHSFPPGEPDGRLVLKVPIGSGAVSLTPTSTFLLGETLRATPPNAPAEMRFEYRPVGAPDWTAGPAFTGRNWAANFDALPLLPSTTYQARFVGQGASAQTSEPFQFRVVRCDASATLALDTPAPVPGSPLLAYGLRVEVAEAADPIVGVSVTASGPGGFTSTVALHPQPGGGFARTLVAPAGDCATGGIHFAATLTGESGATYGNDASCRDLLARYPLVCLGHALQQSFPFCAASPERAYFGVGVSGLPDGAVTLRADGVVVGAFEIVQGQAPAQVSIDASALPEGRVPLQARHQDGAAIEVLGLAADSDVDGPGAAGKSPLIDKTPQSLEVLAPAELGRVCVSRDSTGRATARLDVRATELGSLVELGSGAQYRRGEEPWAALRTLPDTSPRRLPTGGPTAVVWDVGGLGDGEYTVRLATCDRAGHQTSRERRLSLARTPPPLSLAADRPFFSPNGDGRGDTTVLTATFAQPLRLTVEVRRDGPAGPASRHLVTDQPYEPGSPLFAWDGRDDAGQIVPDGAYAIVVRGRDECGVTAVAVGTVEVDTQPPVASIVAPSPGQSVVAGADVRGVANDAHFRSFELAFGAGAAPATWTVFFSGGAAVPPPGGFLGRWNAPAEEGPYVLRLQVADRAENVSTSLVAVTVVPPTLLDRLTVTPPAFSPNGDGRADVATLEYVLRAPATVRLEVRAAGGSVLRTLVPAVQQPGGLHSVGWDGVTEAGGAAPEGEHQVYLAAEASPLAQEMSTALILDRTAPTVSLTMPSPGAYVTPQGVLRGSIHDPRLSSFVVRAQPPAGPEIEIGRGAAEVSDGDLAPLAALQDGAHRLTVLAEDAAGNRSAADVAVTVDSVPPVAVLQSLGAVVHRGPSAIDVKGTAADANLLEYVLAFGAGPQPASFIEIARLTSPVQGASLGPWSVAALPDGTYTLRLVVTDKAGQSSEQRLTLALDGTDPVAGLTTPAEGARLNAEAEVSGSATDAHLERWTLEMAPGPAAEAMQWTMVATGESPVTAGVLGAVAPLPPDGTHTLRLTVRDAAAHSKAALRSFKVDTVPPSAPGALEGSVATSGGTAEVRLRWDAVTDADPGGYRVSRDGSPITPTPIGATSFIDAGRGDGTYRYEVQALDATGNASAPAAITVRVDLTPPLADIIAPRPGQAVSGSVEVRGTALGSDDFKEYRLLAGAGAAPATWTLLKRSSVPVAASILGNWEALGDGPYVLALEADDLAGNTARATVPVRIDNQPPGAAVLVSVANAPAMDALTAAWQASADGDVEGYLLYRNGLLANASGVVVGSLRPYLLPGPDYADLALPDGEHCYRVVTMDQAGNLSPPSNTLCRSLDNRRPHALVVEPPDGTRFEFPVHVLADTPDRDVLSVQFQIKRPADALWQSLGAADAQVPFEVTLDPAPLAAGPYQVRALARDAAGEDPDPVAITVIYGDTTAPAPPQGLTTRVDARDVRLAWSANTEADLAGYHAWRGGERLTTTPISATTFVDTVETPGLHVYRLTAADADGNESEPSVSVDALVYALELLPAFPVAFAATADLPGEGALADSTIEIRRDGAVIAQTGAAAPGGFVVPAVPLLAGANVLTAHAFDAAGNRSIPSEEAVLIANAPPPAVADLQASANGYTVDLTWPEVSAPDLFGYALTRGSTDLTPPVAQSTYASVTATSVAGDGFEPERAFDADAGTAWVAEPGVPSAAWSVTFPAPVLVRKVGLAFTGPVPDYAIEAAWEGRFLPLVRARGNMADTVEHVLPSSFATDTLRVVLAGPSLGIAEVSVEVRALLSATSFQDAAVPDGTHDYAVRAVDRYGVEGPAALRSIDVGDVTPPAAPTGVSAAASGADVLLAWNPAPEADVVHYVVLRDAVAIATTTAPAHVDAGLINGTYRYTVVAVDTAGNRSPASAEVTATVAVAPPESPSLAAGALPNGSIALAWTHAGAAAFVVHRGDAAGGPYVTLGQTGDTRGFLDPTAPRGVPQYYRVHAVDARGNASALSNEAAATSARTEAPAPPAITQPTDADHPVTVTFTDATIEGRAEPGSLVGVVANGTLRGVAEAGAPFAPSGSRALSADATAPVVSADGRRVAFAIANPAPAVVWQDLATFASGSFTHPGADELRPQAFSADGRRLAYAMRACDGAGGCGSDLYVATLESNTVVAVEDGAEDAGAADWSPDGRRIAYTTASPTGCALWIRDLEAAETGRILDAGECGRPRFAPDSARVALAVKPTGGSLWRLLVVDVVSGEATTAADGVWPQSRPSWASDGTRVAFTSAASTALRARVRDLSGGTTDVAEPQLTTFDPQFDPAGGWISFAALRSTAEGPRREVVAEDLRRGGRQVVATWAGDDATGPLALHQWTALHTLALSFADRVALFAAEGQFRLERVRLGPGENTVLARATHPEDGLTSTDSRPVHLTVPAHLFADLRVTSDDLSTYPSIPGVGQGTLLKAHVGNTGAAAATDVRVLLTVRDAAGATRHEQEAQVSQLLAGQAAWVTSLWTPAAAGTYGFRTVADPQDAVAESREDDNRADLGVLVAPQGGLVVRVSSDRTAYEVNAPALVNVRVTNGGPAFSGTVRTTVEAGPAVVAVIDSRDVTLAYGQGLEFTLGWNTALTYAGEYAFATRVTAPAAAASSLHPFRILPDVNVAARLLPESSQVTVGQTAAFNARVGNDSLNAPLDGAVAVLRVVASGGAPVFTSTTALPRILPGGSWQGTLAWPSAQPAGPYEAVLEVASPTPVAAASAPFAVVPAAAALLGTLAVPPHAVRGDEVSAQVAVTNTGTAPLVGKAFAVEVAAETGEVLWRAPFTLDLMAGETRHVTLDVATTVLPAGVYPLFLRAVSPALTLDRQTLHVHGPIGAPSIDSPASGTRVPTAHPTLVVNNAASPAGAIVAYQFQVFADAALTQPLPGAVGVPETAGHTAWRVQVNLAEDRTFYWRARAGDGTATGPWSPVASFLVDAVNLVPSAPVPDGPPPGAPVSSRQPLLVVKNAQDLDLDLLTYDFRVAEDADMALIVTSVANLPEGLGLTSWQVPETLAENQTYFWSARARDAVNESPWTDPISFVVDTVDESPGAPEPRRPVNGAATATQQPELVVGNATDPEGRPLTYRFEVDVVASFDSPSLQVSPLVPEGVGETLWTPGSALSDNTLHYWRSAAHDGQTGGPFAGSSFFVNVANDPPGAPVPLFPAEGATVGTATPELRIQNAADVDHDVLTYEFVVTDESGGTVVAGVLGVAEQSPSTTWTVTPPLAENLSFRWQARASDRQVSGPWSAPQLFRVNAVAEPPTAPALIAPAEGAVLDQLRPALVAANATSPEGLPLTYTFELYFVAPDGTLVLRDSASGVPEGAGVTSFVPGSDLSDGAYRWRCRASDGQQDGTWMATASFTVAVDRPPSAPTAVTAVPGDGQVTLAWAANPEPDVVAYRVYRSPAAGGPYTLRSTVTAPAYTDTGLTNGVTQFYVVTAVDAHFESARSGEVAATPRPPVIAAQIRFEPASIAAECLLGGACWNDDVTFDGECCPKWLYATIELPAGYSPLHIDRAGVRLGGSAAPDSGYWKIVNSDGDGLPELELRFGREKLPPLLAPGTNTLMVSGRVNSTDFRGSAAIQVTAFDVDLRITPTTLKKSSHGNDIEARLTFGDCVKASDVSVASLRLNGTLPVKHVVSVQGHRITVKFDRAAVAALLPVGEHVEVRVTGTLRGLSFKAVDHIRVIP